MRRVLLTVAILAMTVTACSAAEEEPTSGAERPEPTASPTEEPEPEPEPIFAPLTGLEVDDPSVLDRTVVALKVDNASRARPQLALEAADIVFTELVEGGTTRFIALYHSVLPGEAGPVRSGRDVDAQILPAFSPVFGISGAAGPTYTQLRGAGLLVFEEGQAGAFSRDGNRPRPHNLMASTTALEAAGGDLPAAVLPWALDAETPAGGADATGVQLVYSRSYSASWDWDPAGATWRRNQDGGPHTRADGEQLDTDNVVVARVSTFDGAGRDSGGNPIPEVDAVGEGDAIVLRDGRSYAARWRKGSAGAQFEWLTPDGAPLPLKPGRTWVELVPNTGGVTVSTPAPPPAGE